MNRRDMLRTVTASAGLTILKSGTLRGDNAPSNKLNVALVGVWGRGTAHYNSLIRENVVAICDINDQRTKEALAVFPKAKTYWDWRRMLDQKDIEAVVICIADHHHALSFESAGRSAGSKSRIVVPSPGALSAETNPS